MQGTDPNVLCSRVIRARRVPVRSAVGQHRIRRHVRPWQRPGVVVWFTHLFRRTAQFDAMDRVATLAATILTSSAGPVEEGDQLTFAATVMAGTSPVTAGSVTFLVDGTAAAIQTIQTADGQVGFSTSALTVGQHTVTAEFSGVGSISSSSASMTQTIQRRDMTPPC